MTIIAEKDRPAIQNMLARELVEDVELLLFTRGSSLALDGDGQARLSSEETRELLEELVSLSDRLHLTTFDVDADPDTTTSYNVRAVPTVIVRRHRSAPDVASGGDGGANVRFLGLPGGYEFSTLLADVVDVSKGKTDLTAPTRAVVRAIEAPVHIQVFVTPT